MIEETISCITVTPRKNILFDQLLELLPRAKITLSVSPQITVNLQINKLRKTMKNLFAFDFPFSCAKEELKPTQEILLKTVKCELKTRKYKANIANIHMIQMFF